MSLDDHLYDRDGEPITFAQWNLLFEDERYQVIRQTKVEHLFISTIWLGIDMGDREQPVIFETMILGGEEEESWRYTTEADALAHHLDLVDQARLLASS